MRSTNYDLLFCFIFVKYQSIIKYFNPLHICTERSIVHRTLPSSPGYPRYSSAKFLLRTNDSSTDVGHYPPALNSSTSSLPANDSSASRATS